MRVLALALLAGCLAAPAAAQNLAARGVRWATQDCLGPAGFVTQYDPVQPNRWTMRVQHMGDAGTVEQAQQVANPVTWDLSSLTGLQASPAEQRGFRDDPAGRASAFQMACGGAGFWINSAQFSHRLPISGEGPNAVLGRDLDPPMPFGEGIVVSVDAKLPWMRTQTTALEEGTAQMWILWYVRDRRSGRAISQLVGLYDNRPAGIGGSGVEYVGTDGFTIFTSSPLRAVDGTGTPVRFISPPTMGQMSFVDTWSESRRFRVVVTAAQLREVILATRERIPQLSLDPADYDVMSFGVGVEVIVGTGDSHNVQLGGSFANLSLESFRGARFTR